MHYCCSCIGHPPITNYKLFHHTLTWQSECFSLFHNSTFVRIISVLLFLHLDFIFFSNSLHSTALVCQEGITVLSHFSLSSSHPYAPLRKVAFPTGRVSLPKIFHSESGIPTKTWDCPNLFILLSAALWRRFNSDGEPCGLVSHKNCWAIWLCYQATDGQYKVCFYRPHLTSLSFKWLGVCSVGLQ